MNRFSKLVLRGQKTLANRLVVPPMASETADHGGFATERTIQHYRNLSHAKAGLMMVEYTFVHPSGKSEPNQLGIHTDGHIQKLTEIRKIIQSSGAVAGLQLSHGGGKTKREWTGGVLMGPSAIAVPVKDETLEVPTAMGVEEITLWRTSFVEAADRAVKSGFELVELHAAHGYGLNQWISPLTNRRQDFYGGDLMGRARLMFEIIEEIRKRHPGLLMAVRMPGQDFLEGGLTRQDAQCLAMELVARGVDVIDVSSGIGGWRRPRDRQGEGYLVEEARAIQSVIQAPVIGVGGIQTGEYMDDVIGRGAISLAAVGRAVLADPAGWTRRWMQNVG